MERAQKQSLNRRSILFSVITLTVASAIVLGAAQQAEAQQRPAPGPSARKPNILMIMADDIGWFNVSAYNRWHYGLPHSQHRPHRQRRRTVHRLVRRTKLHRGTSRFHHRTIADPYRPGQSWPAGGGHRFATRRPESVAEILKSLGYASGQFGKNHLGDGKDEFLPTNHGFDEFFGNLYHLNAEEEPENPELPEEPSVPPKIRSARCSQVKASDKDDGTIDPHFGRIGKQTIENTGPLTTKAHGDCGRRVLNAALDFIDRQAQGEHPMVLLLQSDAHACLDAS